MSVGAQMIVGTLLLEIHIPGADSLKSKRQILRKVIDRLRSRFNASVAEVANNERWTIATLGVAVVANSPSFVGEVLDKIFRTVDSVGELAITYHDRMIAPVAEFDEDDGPRNLAEFEEMFPEESDES